LCVIDQFGNISWNARERDGEKLEEEKEEIHGVDLGDHL
jgi:hypothetical protein